MADTTVESGGSSQRPGAILPVETRLVDSITYGLTLFAVYLITGAVFYLGGVEKLFAAGGIVAPASVAKQFAGTFFANILGMNFWWGVLGVVELAVFALLVVSLLRGEFLPSRRKSWLMAALGMALVTFSFLSVGQNVTSNFAGAASQWAYFAGAAIMMLLVSKLPPGNSRRFLEGVRTDRVEHPHGVLRRAA